MPKKNIRLVWISDGALWYGHKYLDVRIEFNNGRRTIRSVVWSVFHRPVLDEHIRESRMYVCEYHGELEGLESRQRERPLNRKRAKRLQELPDIIAQQTVDLGRLEHIEQALRQGDRFAVDEPCTDVYVNATYLDVRSMESALAHVLRQVYHVKSGCRFVYVGRENRIRRCAVDQRRHPLGHQSRGIALHKWLVASL